MARRSDGEGSVYPEGDGWRSSLVVGWNDDGTPKRKTFRGRTRKQVVAKLQAAQVSLEQGFVVTGAVPTVAEWMEHWLDAIAVNRIRESTRAGYASKIKLYIVPMLGRHRLDRLTPEHIETAWARMADRGLKPRTIRQTHRILSRALTVAVRRRRLAQNPVTLVDGPSVTAGEVKAFTEDQARAVIDAAAADRLESRWTVAMAMGLRQGEALGLDWSAVDLDAGQLRVRQAQQRHTWRHGCDPACGRKRGADCPQRHGGGLHLVDPKSKKSRRTIPIPDELVDQLRAHRIRQLEERLAAGAGWRGGELGDLVWTQPDGRLIDPRQDWQAWKDLCAAAGVPALRLHDARHTAATMLLVQGVHPRVVMEVLGHSSIQLTLDTYSHVTPQLTEQARAAMGALWRDAR